MKPCPICNSVSTEFFGEVPGYIKPIFYKVQCCKTCDIHFVEVKEAIAPVYHLIYKNREKIPGYTRYHQYADGVLKNSDPLLWLTQQEDIYWGIVKAIYKFGQNGSQREPRILDIGCGLGYLTYALNKAGFDCHGIDISAEAIQVARQRFGDHFTQSAIEQLHTVIKDRFDIIILAELIEHLVDPVETMKACLKLLKPNGRIILTTPNKSAYPASTLWVSDVPPVHLHFFSEQSISRMAGFLNCKVDFVDFTHYNRFNYLPRSRGKLIAPPVHPVFEEQGEPIKAPIYQASLPASVAKYFKVYRFLSLLRAFTVQMLYPLPCRPILCAVMTKM